MFDFNPYGLLIIICIYLIYTFFRPNIYDQLLNGFYEADTSFCEEADLDMFCLYLSNDVSRSGDRSCYILATKEDDIIINEPTMARITQQWAWKNWSSDPTKPRYFNVKFGIDFEGIFPEEQCIRFYPDVGKIVLYHGDTITAVLYKNGINSELKNIKDDQHNEKDYDV
jgi:hypothetical protein